MDICKRSECRQRDPRGSIWLGRHRGLALLLRKYSIDTTNNNLQQYNNLAYVMVPKAGSTTMKNKLNSEGWTETVWLSPTTAGRKTTWEDDPLIFTMIRDPEREWQVPTPQSWHEGGVMPEIHTCHFQNLQRTLQQYRHGRNTSKNPFGK